jgi:MFS family permease
VSIIATLLLQTKIIEVVFVCRLVQGVSVGLTSVFRSLYIKEFVPIELAAKMGSINQLMLSIGLIFTFVQTYVLSLFL